MPLFLSSLFVPCALCINQEQTRSINPWCSSSLRRNLMCSLNFARASHVMESCLGVTQELRPHASPKPLNEDAGIECESLHCDQLGSTCSKRIWAVERVSPYPLAGFFPLISTSMATAEQSSALRCISLFALTPLSSQYCLILPGLPEIRPSIVRGINRMDGAKD